MIVNTAGVAHDQIRIGQDVTIEIRQADETMKLPFAVIAEPA